jgi:hypothetical protein
VQLLYAVFDQSFDTDEFGKYRLLIEGKQGIDDI